MSSIIQITGKLPHHLQNKWIDQVQDLKIQKHPTIDDLIAFVEKAARSANDVMYKSVKTNQCTKATILASSIQPTQSPKKHQYPPCKLCDAQHSLFRCDIFRNMTVQERLDHVNHNNNCSNCLRRGHNNSQQVRMRACK